jgi:hypothetical protein
VCFSSSGPERRWRGWCESNFRLMPSQRSVSEFRTIDGVVAWLRRVSN